MRSRCFAQKGVTASHPIDLKGLNVPERKPRILCLDDQQENLRLRKLFLELFGCQVTAVEDAEECLFASTRETFDIALLDYHLVGPLDGEDVARELRSRLPKLPLVMLTGDPAIPESAKRSVDAVIVKGASNPAELLDTIEKLTPDCTLKPRRKPVAAEDSLGIRQRSRSQNK